MTIQETLRRISLAARYWLKNRPTTLERDRNQGWDNACFFLGLMDAAEFTGDKELLEATYDWCKSFHFEPFHKEHYGRDVLVEHFTGKGRLPWRYEKDEDYQNIHADHVLCGRIYLRLHEAFPERCVPMEPTLKVLSFNADDPHDDCWWWCDAIHMALALYHEAESFTGEARYGAKGYRMYMDARSKLYDEQEQLWYRDWRFLPGGPDAPEQGKVFWGRGNGWVYAGLMHALSVLPKESPYYAQYKADFLAMTPAMLRCQRSDGFWPADMLNPERFDMPENSVTLLTLWAIIRGVRLGILDASVMDVFRTGFAAVNTEAFSEEGRVLWVQGVGDRPGPVEKNFCRCYAVGYYLMTCCEWIRYCREQGMDD